MAALSLKLSGRVLIVDADGRVLLLRRSATSRSNAGKWEFPGGKTDPGEELEATLRREAAEETGLQIELGRVLGASEIDMAKRGIRVAFLYLEAKPAAGTVRLSAEHDAFLWVPRAELPNHDLCPEFRSFAAKYAPGDV